jgi:hypothetical protein
MMSVSRRTAEVLRQLSQHLTDADGSNSTDSGDGTNATDRRTGSTPITPGERAGLGELLPLILRYAEDQGVHLDDERLLALAVHSLAFVRRVHDRETLDPLDDRLYHEVPAAGLTAARRLVDTYCRPRGFAAPDSEVLLFALHFEVARTTAS